MKKRKPHFIIRNVKPLSLTVLIICLLAVYFVPRAVMYPDYAFLGWLIFLSIFFIIPVLVFIVLKSFTKHDKMSTSIALLSVLIIGPTFGLFQEFREKNELLKNGVWVDAIVIEKKVTHKRSRSEWLIQCRYNLMNKQYITYFHNDDKSKHVVGDSLKIICSKEFPKIYALDYNWYGH